MSELTKREIETIVKIAERDGSCLCLFFAEIPIVPKNLNQKLIIEAHALCPLHTPQTPPP